METTKIAGLDAEMDMVPGSAESKELSCVAINLLMKKCFFKSLPTYFSYTAHGQIQVEWGGGGGSPLPQAGMSSTITVIM